MYSVGIKWEKDYLQLLSKLLGKSSSTKLNIWRLNLEDVTRKSIDANFKQER